ncbi:hypothetical protein GCM10010452_41270 [Crossiella cryophila]
MTDEGALVPRANRIRWPRSASLSPRTLATTSRTIGETMTALPSSSQEYHAALTPAAHATSSLRNPGA